MHPPDLVGLDLVLLDQIAVRIGRLFEEEGWQTIKRTYYYDEDDIGCTQLCLETVATGGGMDACSGSEGFLLAS